MPSRCETILAWLREHHGELVGFLESLVNQDSGTYDRADVNRVGDLLARGWAAQGFEVRRIAQAEFGDHLLATRAGAEAGRGLLCIGHMDTVFPAGTAAARPFRIEGDRATGPGVLDMKGGLALLLFAARALAATDSRALRALSLTVLVNSEEEIGSPTSGPLFLEQAGLHRAAIVLEPARPNGECVVGRKGVGHFRVEVSGRQAHAGSQPELGVNAIWELAHKVCAMQSLTDLTRGTTVNVGVIRGGERPNVVPDRASADVDLRIWSAEEGERVTQAFREIAERSTIPGATGTLSGKVSTPPWQTNEGTRRMLDILKEAGSPLGLNFAGVTSGGGSDGSRTAQVIPTLDGLGPVGSKMHSPEEYVELPSLLTRTALLALFIETWYERFRS